MIGQAVFSTLVFPNYRACVGFGGGGGGMLRKGCDTQCPKYYQNFAWHELDEDYTVSKRALVTVVCLKKQKHLLFYSSSTSFYSEFLLSAVL